MERKYLGLLLIALGAAALLLADMNLLKTIFSFGYKSDYYPGARQSPSGFAVLGYISAGLLLIFLGIRIIRKNTSA